MKRDAIVSAGVAAAGLLFTGAVCGNDLILNGEPFSNGLNVLVYAPVNFTNRVEIYTCSNLTSGDWRLVAENLRPDGGHPVRWYTDVDENGFFAVENMDIDRDGDGLPDSRERYVYKTLPSLWDSDGDWLPDSWEVANSLDALTSNRAADPDNDGLDNGTECMWGTNPFSPDSDHDGMTDAWEIESGTDPNNNDAQADPDGDGLGNYGEFTAGTNPAQPDTDKDGVPDGFEARHGMNPCDPHDLVEDLDGDLIPNFYEYMRDGSDPSDPASQPMPSAVVSIDGHDGTFTNIQEAVNAVTAESYPIVFVEPGTYRVGSETVLALSNVLIYAARETVVLDGGGSNRLFHAVSGRPVLAGLILQNGYSSDGGGAIYISEAKPVVHNCLFVSNRSDGNGGAVYSGGYTLGMINCVFQGNQARRGGAVYCENDGPELINCTWTYNHAIEQGGAIYKGSVINGLVWSNLTDTGNPQIYGAAVSYSCVEGGFAGVSNTMGFSRLVHGWHLANATSSCIDSGDMTGPARFDFDGELRGFLPDIGADEWVDSDGDGLPDWWEKKWFGNLNRIINGNLPADDSDRRLSYIQKYLYELNPVSSDYDGDGLPDYAEIYIYKTDPLTAGRLEFPVSYVWEQTAYDWEDISLTGQAITNFNNMDDGQAQIQLGIQFPFSDAVYNTAYVCNNGFVSFGSGSVEFANEFLPSAALPEKTLCVLWDDYRMKNDPLSRVYFQSYSNRCIIAFAKIPFWERGLTNRLDFQVILNESGNIYYQYKNISNDGTLPTVGMQWGAGNIELYAANITNMTAISIFSDSPATDCDSDGIGDVWEKKWFERLNVITNGSEFISQSNRFTYAEAAYLGLNPNTVDTDGDRLSDTYEVEKGMNPAVPQDSDNDGIPDFYETANGLNSADPADALLDPDGDDFPNVYEYRHNTDPFSAVSVPLPNLYVSLSGTHIAPFTNSVTASTNIQAALAIADAYDIIQITDGTYAGNENRNLSLHKPLILFSENGPETCILDCGLVSRGLYAVNSTGLIIRGIQFLHGFSDYGYGNGDSYGGAVYCSNTIITLDTCRFRENIAANAGGVLYGLNSSITVTDCSFSGNGEESAWGGLAYFEGADVTISGCTVTGTQGYEGLIFYNSDILIQNSVFSNNACCTVAGDWSRIQIQDSKFVGNQGYNCGGIEFWACDASISNSVFSGNSGRYGGAFYCQQATELGLVNCLFSDNSAAAGVIYFQAGSVRMQNCTVFSNQCAGVYSESSAAITLRNTILWSNDAGSCNTTAGVDVAYCCLPEIAGTNNIHADPKLIAETGALLPDSPCIDRGSDSTASVTDIVGTLRWDHPWRSNRVDTSIADIGAVEFTDSDTDADRMGDLWEIYYFTNITFSSGSDVDGDGLSTLDEYRLNTNPASGDSDGDGLTDGEEVGLRGTNPLSADSDSDSLSDAEEMNLYGTNPLNADTDGDGLPDGWEVRNSMNPLFGSNASADSDSDGLTDFEEYAAGTDFQNSDSDNDGMSDGWETDNGLHPLVNDALADADSDGLTNIDEYMQGSDPQDKDSDKDGMPNAWEQARGLDFMTDDAGDDGDGDGLTNLEECRAQTDPRLRDTDADLLNDGDEIYIYHTNPRVKDTDGDGMSDGFEVDQGRDPAVSDSVAAASSGDALFAMHELLSSGSGIVPSADADDDGQLNVDELHRYPTFTILVRVSGPDMWTPPEILFNGAIAKTDTYRAVLWGNPVYEIEYAKVFYGEPGSKYSVGDILNVTVPAGTWSFPQLYTSAHIVGDIPGNPAPDYYTQSDAGQSIYPFSCNYRVERAPAGNYGRKMSLTVNDDDDNSDGIPDCNNDLIDGIADKSDMGMVVFEKIIIHPDAPSPGVYLSASPELRIFDATTGNPIAYHRKGNLWCGSNPPNPLPPVGIEDPPLNDLFNVLRSGDFTVLVEGIAPGEDPNQTADGQANYSSLPPFYGPGDTTSQGPWGTYLGLYFKSTADRYSYFENDMIRFSVKVTPRIKLIPDWNRDRQINSTDETANAVPFRFWINDDNDSGDVARGSSDVPGQENKWWKLNDHANYQDSKVNGPSDLTDFFPVWLNIASALTAYPPSNSIIYKLHYPMDALHFIYTDLTRSHAGDYLITDIASCGRSFNQNVSEADTVTVLQSGVDLNSAFLERIADNPNKGVLLIEAAKALTAPLLLTIVSNGTILAYTELPLSISGVEDMFRHVNLRADGTGASNRTNAPNLPDSVTGNHALAFVHGYNVDGRSARATFSETFKRLWQSGFNGRFIGVSWFGNPNAFLTNLGPPNYYQGISQAFAVADEMAAAIEAIKQNVAPVVDVIAHSAGNIVVGSAIQDYNCTFRNYIALNSATPLEAYGSDANVAPDASGYYRLTGTDEGMTSTASFDEGVFSVNGYAWNEYDARLHASEWHKLFAVSDTRCRLTWRNRFGSVNTGGPAAYNFYSGTEEVLRNYEEASLVHGSFMDWLKMLYNVAPAPGEFSLEAGDHFCSLYVWVKQEKLKGRKDTWLPFFGGVPGQWGGWGFAEEGQFIKGFLGIDLRPRSPAEVQAAINGPDADAFWQKVKTEPLFRNRPAVLFGLRAGDYLRTDSSNVPGLHDRVTGCSFSNWLLANAFPSRSWAMGANANSKWDTEKNNFDMSSIDFMTDVTKWPKARYCPPPGGGDKRMEWHHSDFKDIAYPHVYKLYEKWMELTEE